MCSKCVECSYQHQLLSKVGHWPPTPHFALTSAHKSLKCTSGMIPLSSRYRLVQISLHGTDQSALAISHGPPPQSALLHHSDHAPITHPHLGIPSELDPRGLNLQIPSPYVLFHIHFHLILLNSSPSNNAPSLAQNRCPPPHSPRLLRLRRGCGRR